MNYYVDASSFRVIQVPLPDPLVQDTIFRLNHRSVDGRFFEIVWSPELTHDSLLMEISADQPVEDALKIHDRCR